MDLQALDEQRYNREHGTHKICELCEEEKALAAFYPDDEAEFGVMSVCKACVNETNPAGAPPTPEDGEPVDTKTATVPAVAPVSPPAVGVGADAVVVGSVTAKPAASQTKRCRKCQEEKETGEFWANRRSSDGLQPYCKPCTRDSNKRKPADAPAPPPAVTPPAAGEPVPPVTVAGPAVTISGVRTTPIPLLVQVLQLLQEHGAGGATPQQLAGLLSALSAFDYE